MGVGVIVNVISPQKRSTFRSARIGRQGAVCVVGGDLFNAHIARDRYETPLSSWRISAMINSDRVV